MGENKKVSTKAIKRELQRIKTLELFRKMIKSTVFYIVVIIAFSILISTLFFSVLQVTGSSMNPTLEENDVVLLGKTNRPHRGDLIAFYWQNKILIKRVIGVPGDEIVMNNEGEVFVNGEKLKEDYISKKQLGEVDIDFPYEVVENKYFVLGDARDVSMDSRDSSIGCVDKSMIIGKILFNIWPL